MSAFRVSDSYKSSCKNKREDKTAGLEHNAHAVELNVSTHHSLGYRRVPNANDHLPITTDPNRVTNGNVTLHLFKHACNRNYVAIGAHTHTKQDSITLEADSDTTCSLEAGQVDLATKTRR